MCIVKYPRSLLAVKKELIKLLPSRASNKEFKVTYSRGKLCSDCSSPAKFKVTESSQNVWYYCGMCEIGG